LYQNVQTYSQYVMQVPWLNTLYSPCTLSGVLTSSDLAGIEEMLGRESVGNLSTNHRHTEMRDSVMEFFQFRIKYLCFHLL